MHHQGVIQAVLEVEPHIAGGLPIHNPRSLRMQLHIVGGHHHPGAIDGANFADQRRVDSPRITAIRSDSQVPDGKTRGRFDADLRSARPAELAPRQVEAEDTRGERGLGLAVFGGHTERAALELPMRESAAASDKGHRAVLDLAVDGAIDFKVTRRPESSVDNRRANRLSSDRSF